MPKYVILPFVFVTIVYWMCNLNPDVGRFFSCVGIVILVANCSVAFGKNMTLLKRKGIKFTHLVIKRVYVFKGSFLSAVAPSANAALGLSGPLLVPLMIFSGFFLNNS